MHFVKTDQDRPGFSLVHISDFHLCRPAGAPLAWFGNKRALSYFSWRIRRRRQHDPAILDTLVQAVRAEAADHVVVTGDLTQLALAAEFDAARRYLADLGSPQNVFLVPGNHDALVGAGCDDRLRIWADYLAPDGCQAPHRTVFPTLRVRGSVALIGLSSAHPTRPFSAAGSIGAEQLARCSRLLAETGRRSLYRILLIHHPPVAGMLSARKRLVDAEALAQVVQQHGADLVLHGHGHRRSRAFLPGPQAPIPVRGAPSASATSCDPLRRAGFAVVRINRASSGWKATFQDHWYAHEQRCFLLEAPESIG